MSAEEAQSTSSVAEKDSESETDVLFEQGGVCQCFSLNGKGRGRKELVVPGKLMFTADKYGKYVEWKPDDKISDLNQGTNSSDSVNFGGGDIAYHAVRDGGEDVEKLEFIEDSSRAEFRRPIKFELIELRSFTVSPKSKPVPRMIFILADGSSLNPFMFRHGAPENFIEALKRWIRITKTKSDKSLYMVQMKKERDHDHGKLTQTIAQLYPDEYKQFDSIVSFVKDLRNDPYTTAMASLAKLSTVVENISGATSPSASNERDPSLPSENSISGDDGMEADYATNEDGYEVVFKPEIISLKLPPKPRMYRGQPLSQEQWLDYMQIDGSLCSFDEIRHIIFRGGIEDSLRRTAWPFLLGVYSPSSTHKMRCDQSKKNIEAYHRMKLQWETISLDQEDRFSLFRDYKGLIDKDVTRTDRTIDYFKGDHSHGIQALKNVLMTYMMYNFNLGYVQGMSDILAPILMETHDEVETFWIFVKFMDRMEKNFEMSQESMQKQLQDCYELLRILDTRLSGYLDACGASNMFFAFRWLLIVFKREFPTSDCLTLWEALWTDLPGPNFHLFIVLAILLKHKSTIIENKFGLTEILRHVNDLAMKIDVEATLCSAESLYLQLLSIKDQLPNKIRSILGLPEIAESSDLSCSSNEGDKSSENNTTSTLANVEAPRDSDALLESQFDQGLSNFY